MLISLLSKPTLFSLASHVGVRNATRAFSSSAAASSSHAGLIEIREYTLKPEGFMDFIKISEDYSDVRKELLPFLG